MAKITRYGGMVRWYSTGSCGGSVQGLVLIGRAKGAKKGVVKVQTSTDLLS